MRCYEPLIVLPSLATFDAQPAGVRCEVRSGPDLAISAARSVLGRVNAARAASLQRPSALVWSYARQIAQDDELNDFVFVR